MCKDRGEHRLAVAAYGGPRRAIKIAGGLGLLMTEMPNVEIAQRLKEVARLLGKGHPRTLYLHTEKRTVRSWQQPKPSVITTRSLA